MKTRIKPSLYTALLFTTLISLSAECYAQEKTAAPLDIEELKQKASLYSNKCKYDLHPETLDVLFSKLKQADDNGEINHGIVNGVVGYIERTYATNPDILCKQGANYLPALKKIASGQ